MLTSSFSLARCFIFLVFFSGFDDHSPPATTPRFSSALVPSGTLLRLWIIHTSNSNFYYPFVVPICGGGVIQSRRSCHVSGFSCANYVSRLFSRFRGRRTFHNVQFFMFRNATDYPAARFLNSNPMVFPRPLYFFPSSPVVAAVFWFVLRYCWRISSLSSGVAAPQHLGSLRTCCIPFSADLSSRTSVLSGCLVAHWPWYNLLWLYSSGTAGHLPAGDDHSLPGITNCLDPSLRLLSEPPGQIPVPTPLPKSGFQAAHHNILHI